MCLKELKNLIEKDMITKMSNKKINEFDSLKNNHNDFGQEEPEVFNQEEPEVTEEIFNNTQQQKNVNVNAMFSYSEKEHKRKPTARNINPRTSIYDTQIDEMGANIQVTDSTDIIANTYRMIKADVEAQGLSIAFFYDDDDTIYRMEMQGWEVYPSDRVIQRKTALRRQNSRHDGLVVGDLVAMVRDRRLNAQENKQNYQNHLTNTQQLFDKFSFRTPDGRTKRAVYNNPNAHADPFADRSGVREIS